MIWREFPTGSDGPVGSAGLRGAASRREMMPRPAQSIEEMFVKSTTGTRPPAGLGAQAAVAYLLMGAVMISFSGVWVKVAHVTPTVSAFYRVLFGGIILLVICLARGEVRNPGVRAVGRLIICGLFFAVDLAFYHASIGYVGPGLGTILPNFQVFILAAVGILFLKETVRPLFYLSVPLGMAGLFMIVGVGGTLDPTSARIGISFGLGAAACYAVFLLFLRSMQAEGLGGSVFFLLTLVSLTTAVLLGAEIAVSGGSFRIPDLQTWLALLALGFFSQSVGWLLITRALPRLRASLSGLVLLLQPSLAFVWDVLLFDRPTTAVNWLGVLITVSAIYAGALGRGKK